MFDIGAVTAIEHLYRAAIVRVFAQLLQNRRLVAATSSLGLLRNGIHSAIDADGEDFLDAVEVCVFAVMQHEGPVAAETCGDHLPRFGVFPHISWQ